METDIKLQYNEAVEGFIEGSYPSSNYYIENSNLVAIPEAPNSSYSFDIDKKQWVDNRTLVSSGARWELVKTQRIKLLAESDWTQMPDVALSNKEAWAVYRQALRDITNQTDPFNITWPTAPGG